MRIATIEVERINPHSAYVPPAQIRARLKRHPLVLPDGTSIDVFALDPMEDHSDEERANIITNFPFFHRKILSPLGQNRDPVEGFLLSPIPGQDNKERFDSYYSSVEIFLKLR